jgi:hypothetical protein
VPFTTYHLASGLLVGLFLKKWVNWLALLITTTILVDVEPILVVAGVWRQWGPHGVLHTFIASVPMGLASGALLYITRGALRSLRVKLYLESDDGLKSYLVAGVIGWLMHVLLDAPLYYDIRPLYPLEVNPLLGSLSIESLWVVYDALLVGGFVAYSFHFYKQCSGEGVCSLLRAGALVILLGLVTSLHGFDIGLGVLKWWLLPVSYAMTLAGVYFTLRCLLWINAISERRATIAGASSTLAITLLYVAHQGVLTMSLISLLLLITALALRGGLNHFRLRWVKVGLGDALLLSVVTLPVLVGGALLIALLVMVVTGFYTYNDQLAKKPSITGSL